MVELAWTFSLAERQPIHRGTYRSVPELNAKIRAFTWTKTAEQVLAKATRKRPRSQSVSSTRL